MRNPLFFFLILPALSFCPKLKGQSGSLPVQDSSRIYLDELVVSASRFQESRQTVPEAIVVKKEKNLLHSTSRSTPEAILNMPAVFLQKTNHGGGSPFLRGLTGNQVLLLYDDIRLNNATYRYGPNQYFNTIDPFGVGSIEVLLGSGAIQYGSDAMGGSVQVFSKDLQYAPKSKFSGLLLGQFTTQGMEESGRAELAWSNARSAWRGAYTYRHFGDLVAGGRTGRQSPTGYSEWAYDLKGKIALGKKANLTLFHQALEQSDVPIFHKIKLENFVQNHIETQKRELSYLRFQGFSKFAWTEQVTATLSRQNTQETRISQKINNPEIKSETDQVNNIGLNLLLRSRINQFWIASSGMEVYYDRVNSEKRIKNSGNTSAGRGLYPDDSKMLNWAAFSQHEARFGTWLFRGGLRWNAYQIQLKDAVLGDVELSPSAFVWSAAVQKQAGSHINLFLSYNSGFRAPNIDDLGTLGIVDFRYEVPNGALKPEASHNFQLGAKYLTPRFQAEAYLFRNELRQLISRVKMPDQIIQGYPVYQKENTDNAYIQGAETSFKMQISKGFSASGQLAYAFGHNLYRQEPLRRIPPMHGALMLRYEKNKYFSRIEWIAATKQDRLAQGDKDDNRIPTGGTPGWDVVNLHGGWTYRVFNIMLSANNLFNKDYRYHGSGIQAIGRSVSARAALIF
jgi:hemoglobin/transferrin/lactoferrin receptor protein